MNFVFNTGFPILQDSLGGTRSRFYQDWLVLSDYLKINHFKLQNPNEPAPDDLAGKHKWVTFPEQTTKRGFPANTATEMAIFGQLDAASKQQLWLQPTSKSSNTDSIQLTASDIKVDSFSTNEKYKVGAGLPQTRRLGGWTFLPGKLLLQYGSFTFTGTGAGIVSFPIPFSGVPFCITTNSFFTNKTPGSASTTFVSSDRTTNEKLGFTIVGSTSTTGFYWQAIGKA